MKPLRVLVTGTAERQIRAVGSWWRRNRPAAADLFERELENALALLSRAPEAGASYPLQQLPDVRRRLLPRSRYHVYYSTDERAGVLVVRAVWHAMRGRGPRL